MTLELLAFTIEYYSCTPTDEPKYKAFADAVRNGDKDAIEEMRVNGNRGIAIARSSWADVKQAQSAGIYEKPRNEYGGITYYELLKKIVVERGEIDIRNRWEIARLPNGEYSFGYHLSTTASGTNRGVSIWSERYPSLNQAKRALCESALKWISQNKKTKQLKQHFESLLVETKLKRLVQLELF